MQKLCIYSGILIFLFSSSASALSRNVVTAKQMKAAGKLATPG
jgi:hypothetical protein